MTQEAQWHPQILEQKQVNAYRCVKTHAEELILHLRERFVTRKLRKFQKQYQKARLLIVIASTPGILSDT